VLNWLRDLINLIPDWVPFVKDALLAIIDILGDVWTKAEDAYEGALWLWEYLVSTLEPRIEQARDLALAMRKLAYDVLDRSNATWNYVREVLEALARQAVQLGLEAWFAAQDALKRIEALAASVAQDVNVMLTLVRQDLAGLIDGVRLDLERAISSRLEELRRAFTELVAPAVNFVAIFGDQVGAFFADPVGWLSDRLADAWDREAD